jgi:hypothetical protein
MPRWVCYSLVTLAATAVAQDCTQTIPVRVVDKDTRLPIEPLTAAMVTARLGDVSLPVSALAQIGVRRIVVLIDESGSMAGGGTPSSPFSHHQRDAILAVKQTLSELMAKLPPGVSIEYGLFNEKWVLSGTFISDPAEVRRSIDEVTASFANIPYVRTAIYDSLHEALKRFGEPQAGDSILLLTDGFDNRSKLSAKELEQEFRATKARLLTMVVYAPYIFAAQEQAKRTSVQELVARTGGSTLAINPVGPSWANNKENLLNTDMVRRFWNERVLTTDVIQVQVPSILKKEAKWKLSLNPEADARLKHAVVIYPTRLSPCRAATAP